MCSVALDLAAGRLDRLARTLGHAESFDRDGALDLARLEYARTLSMRRHDARLLERLEVDDAFLDVAELVETNLGHEPGGRGPEPDLRQAALQRHLAALEADLVVAALARPLTFYAAATGLALAGGRAATDAQPRLLAARSGRDGVELHGSRLRTVERRALRLPRRGTGAATR